MVDFDKAMLSFLDAQRKRLEVYENGQYQLDENEGMRCGNCDWSGLTVPIAEEDVEAIAQCPDCESTDILTGDRDISYYQEFGYEYERFPSEYRE